MRLVRTDADGHGESFELAGEALIVGRKTSRGVQIEHPTLSREHARLFARDGAWQVADLNSSNGTFVNGAQVTKATLKVGDVVKLGGVEFRVDDGAKTVVAGATDEITLEDDFFETAKPKTAPSPPVQTRAAAAAANAPLSTSAPSMAAPPPPKRLSTKNLTRKSDAKDSGGVMQNDFAQYGGFMKLVILVACVAAAYGLYLGAMKLTETVVPERSTPPAETDAGDADAGDADAGK